MRYVGGGASDGGCVFCARLAGEDDVRSLILHRGEQAFVIMNLYPYNTGHVMLVPNRHVAGPEEASAAEMAELAGLVPATLRALRRSLNCHGFNLGLNVGAVAGAGVADHLHQHVVPRWQGDANFMPILAATTVLPELIPVTYAKLRAELGRVTAGASAATVAAVVLGGEDDRVLLGDDGRLPTATAAGDEAVWRAAERAVAQATGGPSTVVGWAGPTGATTGAAPLALTMHPLAPVAPNRAAWISVSDALGGPDGPTVAAALANLAVEETIS